MKAPKCRLCGENHWGNESHKWSTGISPKDVATQGVHNSTKKVKPSPKRVHNVEIKDEVCTQVREVSIRQFRGNMASELRDLPFRIVKNGKVIAIVSGE